MSRFFKHYFFLGLYLGFVYLELLFACSEQINPLYTEYNLNIDVMKMERKKSTQYRNYIEPKV